MVWYIAAGQEVTCHNCGRKIIIPEAALPTGEESTILRERLMAPRAPYLRRRPTIADRIKEEYRRIESWIGVVATGLSIFFLQKYIVNRGLMLIVSCLIGLVVYATISNLRREEEESTPKSELEKPVEPG